MADAVQHAAASAGFWQFLNDNWVWLIWVVPGILGSFFEGARDFVLDLVRELGAAFHRNREAVPARQPAPELLLAGCRHPHAIAVRNELTGKREAWLCPDCDEQLPANWALSKEDLK